MRRIICGKPLFKFPDRVDIALVPIARFLAARIMKLVMRYNESHNCCASYYRLRCVSIWILCTTHIVTVTHRSRFFLRAI